MDAGRETQDPGRIVVGMSGGVDSSVAAARCVERGWDVVGVFLKNGVAAPAGGPQRCCSAGDAADARAVAARLGIAFYALDESEAFEGLIDGFVSAYAAGRTPNPCVTCNREIKIAALERVAAGVGATAVATGHYARHDPTGTRLRRAADRAKDQSYFLAGLTPAQVARCRFPLGDLDKAQVRAVARRMGLAVADKAESQEICFVAGRSYRELVAARRPDALAPGVIETVEGRPLGVHAGVAGFTVGQRRGLGLGGGDLRYVTAIDAARARVVVGPRAALQRRDLAVEAMRWWGPAPDGPFPACVQIRHRQAGVPATVTPDGGGARVTLRAPVHGVAPGQVAAFYDPDDEVLLGAGTLLAAFPPGCVPSARGTGARACPRPPPGAHGQHRPS